MGDFDSPDQDPKTQPKGSGGPPRPPKITARDLADGAPDDNEARWAIVEFYEAQKDAEHLVELLGYLRESRWTVAINKLEAALDARIVELTKGDQLKHRVFHDMAKRRFKSILAYRSKYPRLATGEKKLREQAQKILDDIRKGQA